MTTSTSTPATASPSIRPQPSPSPRTRPDTQLALWLVAAIALGGCARGDRGPSGAGPPANFGDPSGVSGGSGSIDLPIMLDDGDAAAWPFWPESVRIYPLTRVVHDESSDRWYVEARIEFLDELGDSSKACGTLELAIFDEPSSGGRTPIDSWTTDLRTVPLNARSYDPVTRTYLYKLDVPSDILDQDPVLYVRHDSLDGRTMTDRLELRTAR
ncbi:MAG: hypothetical protein AB8G96_04120 [Phycisphaerales bacterium]